MSIFSPSKPVVSGHYLKIRDSLRRVHYDNVSYEVCESHGEEAEATETDHVPPFPWLTFAIYIVVFELIAVFFFGWPQLT